mmetsp:Transcript_3408/g.8479  ORF Transcript_3408/g.8479 Transcript_3408/m.8479 type:complete len:226 (+) Transcript_3408:71-748(+)
MELSSPGPPTPAPTVRCRYAAAAGVRGGGGGCRKSPLSSHPVRSLAARRKGVCWPVPPCARPRPAGRMWWPCGTVMKPMHAVRLGWRSLMPNSASACARACASGVAAWCTTLTASRAAVPMSAANTLPNPPRPTPRPTDTQGMCAMSEGSASWWPTHSNASTAGSLLGSHPTSMLAWLQRMLCHCLLPCAGLRSDVLVSWPAAAMCDSCRLYMRALSRPSTRWGV